tara:strand:+ start:335 stop:628 length:294 start_codon:yes stop_codon:yes gene_type:complete
MNLKTLLLILVLPLITNCAQYSSMLSPGVTLASGGTVAQATSSLTSSVAINSFKQNYQAEVNSELICPTVHSSELNKIFFETLEHMDCFYDPMSIYR